MWPERSLSERPQMDGHHRECCLIRGLVFGEPRQSGSSHRIYKTPWIGDPRVNIQDDHGKAKAYQVKQVLAAIERMELKEDE